MEEATLRDDGASEATYEGSVENGADEMQNEEKVLAGEESTSYPREFKLQFEPRPGICSSWRNFSYQEHFADFARETYTAVFKKLIIFIHDQPLVSAGSAHEPDKKRPKPRTATPLGRHGLTFSSPPHVPRVRLKLQNAPMLPVS